MLRRNQKMAARDHPKRKAGQAAAEGIEYFNCFGPTSCPAGKTCTNGLQAWVKELSNQADNPPREYPGVAQNVQT